jgi:hypothetical protein
MKARLYDVLKPSEQKMLEKQLHPIATLDMIFFKWRELAELKWGELNSIGMVLLQSEFGSGKVPDVTVSVFAMQTLHARAIQKGLDIF